MRSPGVLISDLAHQNQEDELSTVVPFNSY